MSQAVAPENFSARASASSAKQHFFSSSSSVIAPQRAVAPGAV